MSKNGVLFAAVIAAAIVASAILHSGAAGAQTPVTPVKTQRYEYRVFSFSGEGKDANNELERRLAIYVEKGWRVVGVTPPAFGTAGSGSVRRSDGMVVVERLVVAGEPD